MTNLEARVKRLEDEIRDLKRLIAALQGDVGKLRQDAFAGTSTGGGGGGGGNPLFCSISSALAASGTIGSGSPAGPITGQTVYSISGGAYLSVSTSADILNGLPTAIPSGKACIVESNPDGTYAVIAVVC